MLTLSLDENDWGYWGVLAYGKRILRLELFCADYNTCRLRLVDCSPLLKKEFSFVLGLDPQCLSDLEPASHFGTLRRKMLEYSRGKRIDFRDILLHDYGSWTPFKRKVTQIVHQLDYGRTITYMQLARLAESPGASRAVGSVMSNNPFPILVPCHRVVGSGGKLGGFSAPGGIATKQHLLNLEQHVMTANI